MSEHKAGEFIHAHKNAEIGAAIGIAATTAGVIAATKLIRHRRRTEPAPTYTGANVPEVKAEQRRAYDDNIIRLAQAETYRKQLSVFRHDRMRPRSRELLLGIALETYKATYETRAGSIQFEELQGRLEVRPRNLDKALGRLVRNGIIVYQTEDPANQRVAGFRDSGVLKWAYWDGNEEDIPEFHNLVNDSLQSKIVGLEGYHNDED